MSSVVGGGVEVPSKRPLASLGAHISVSCIAFGTMVLELVQTRVLSSLFQNHLVYLTVTIALLGFGISGAIVSVVSRRLETLDHWAAIAISGFAVSSFLCLRLASFSAGPSLGSDTSTQIKLLACYGVLVVPFFFAGASLALLFMRNRADTQKLYFSDLAASAVGAVAFTLLLRPLGAEALIWLVTGSAFVGLVAFSASAGIRWRMTVAVAVLVLVGAGLWGPSLLNNVPESYKLDAQVYDPARKTAKLEASQWTTITKITVLSDPLVSLFSRKPDPHAGDVKIISQDGSALAVMPGPKLRAETWRLARLGQPREATQLANVIRPRPADALVIGVGGGQDIDYLRAFGAGHIVGIEINPATFDLDRGPYRDYLEWPKAPEVDFKLAEGRHFVHRTVDRFDTLTMTAVDTLSALSAGAYVFSENYLYTVEAVQDYLSVLRPHGVLTITRWLFRYPRETMRLANIALYALERSGVREPSKCMFIVAQTFGETRWAATMIKKEPFTKDEVDRMLAAIAGRQDAVVVYLPNIFDPKDQASIEASAFQVDRQAMRVARPAFRSLIRGDIHDRKEFERTYYYDISPVYDDRPFFFAYNKTGELFKGADPNLLDNHGLAVHYVLYVLLLVTGCVAGLGILVPLYVFEKEGLQSRGVRSLLALFASLGAGFIFIELGVIQKLNLFLGHPMYSLAVVLAALLLWTGVGSLVASRSAGGEIKLLRKGLIGSSLVTVAWLTLVSLLIPRTIGWPLILRVTLVIVSLLPVGLMMGIPFATGLKYVGRSVPRFIPWAWGINGLTTVMGSILAIIVAMHFGFAVVIVLGSIFYLAGLCAVSMHARSGWGPGRS